MLCDLSLSQDDAFTHKKNLNQSLTRLYFVIQVDKNRRETNVTFRSRLDSSINRNVKHFLTFNFAFGLIMACLSRHRDVAFISLLFYQHKSVTVHVKTEELPCLARRMFPKQGKRIFTCISNVCRLFLSYICATINEDRRNTYITTQQS